MKGQKKQYIFFTTILLTYFFITLKSVICFPQKRDIPFPSSLEEKLKSLRKLSIQTGLPQKELPREELCLEDGCLETALNLLEAINGSVNPCKNFYSFACGKWSENHAIPPHHFIYDQSLLLTEKIQQINIKILNETENPDDFKPINQAKKAFNDCIDLQKIEKVGLQPLKELISELGGWELINPSQWNASEFNWLKSEAEVFRKTGKSSLVSVMVLQDNRNNSRTVLILDQPELILPRNILIAPENYSTIITAYENLIYEVAKEIGSTQNEADLRNQAKAIIAFQSSLARITSSPENRADHETLYNNFTLKTLQDKTDIIDESNEFTINWKEYLDQVFRTSGVYLTENEPIVVFDLWYIEKLVPLLKQNIQKNPKTFSNLLIWRAISGLLYETTENMRKIEHRYISTRFGSIQQPKRELFCENLVSDNFGMALGAKFIAKANFDSEAKTEVDEMVENLRSAFKEMMRDEADWMQNETRLKAIKKVDTMRSLMAYPDWLHNKTKLEEIYEGLEFLEGEGQGHFSNQLKTLQWKTEKMLKKLRQPVEKNMWVVDPGDVNAAYHMLHNSIIFPAGILQPPFFGKGRPKHQNYGGIGAIIGHEITHGFAKEGSQYNVEGNLENWWDLKTKVEFEKRSKCMEKQYSEYHVENGNVSVNLNGVVTLGENIADNGGLRESFRAYQKYVKENGRELRLPGLEVFSSEQLFFLGFAHVSCESITQAGLMEQVLTETHSPVRFRVNGAIRNFREFANAFNCPADEDGMNPPKEKQCTVW